MRRAALLVALAVPAAMAAAERIELADDDGDGRQETRRYYQGKTLVRAVADKNGDEKPDIITTFEKGLRARSEADKNFDGKSDVWMVYDEKGQLRTTARDSNFDGKPDQYKELLAGRDIVLKEMDTNHDGRIDKRALTQWDGNRVLTIYNNNRPQKIPMPSYLTLWSEEDRDFDGKIDHYRERGKKEGEQPKHRLGKPISKRPEPILAAPDDGK